ncbi:MAG: hypothetical protein V7K61_20995 [Nostoc sp.]
MDAMIEGLNFFDEEVVIHIEELELRSSNSPLGEKTNSFGGI